jgi:hypothetical protein
MRLLTFLLFFAICYIANGQEEQSILVNKNYQRQPLVEILNDLETQYPLSFYYEKEWISSTPLSYTFDNQPIEQVLTTLLENTALTFNRFNNFAYIIAPKKSLGKTYEADYYIAKYQSIENLEEIADQGPKTITIGSENNINSTGKGKISGKIFGKDKEALIGAVLRIEKLNLNTITDLNGNYVFNLPVGKHLLETQMVGYIKTQQAIEVFNDGTLDFQLQEEIYELGAIVVAGTSSDNNIRSSQIGVARLTPLAIKQLPSFLGEADVIKSLLTIPGVNSVGEGASGFNVRGGNIDQNLILQDEALVFNASHILGFFSVFNADIIKGVTLYKGHVPAQFGGRLSSVLEINTKNADNQQFKTKGGIGIVSSRATLEIPLIKEKTSLLLAGRSSYSDWIIRRAKNLDLKKSSAYFYDTNAKLSHIFNNGSNIALGYYRSFDFFRYSQDFGYEWGTELVSLEWNQIISQNFSSDTKITYGILKNAFFDPEGFDSFTLKNGLENFKIKQNFFFTGLEKNQIRLGASLIDYNGLPETFGPRTANSVANNEFYQKDKGREWAFYINDEIEWNDRFSFSLGLRYSLFQQLGPEALAIYEQEDLLEINEITNLVDYNKGEVIKTYANFEPRLSLKVGLQSTNSIKLSYNKMAQYIHLISNTTASTPVDIWQVSTPYIPPQLADNYSIGYFQNFNNNQWESSLEFFYKDISQLVEYKDLPELLRNEHIETALLIGEGRAYGTELLIKKNTGRWTGQLAYTFSRSERKVAGDNAVSIINNGKWFPSNFDSPHNINLTFKYQVNRRHLFSANFTYRQGRPTTTPLATYTLGGVDIPHYAPRNQFRIPNYHRLDLSYTFNRNAIRNTRFKGSLTFAIYNIYFRKNAFSLFFKKTTEGTISPFRLAVLGAAFPSITYNFEF